MNKQVNERLLEINRDFYRDFAEQFSSTRMRLQRGVKRIIAQISENTTILDIGCGNGELYLELVRNGFRGNYNGIDFSSEMISIAKERSKISLLNDTEDHDLQARNPVFLIRDITTGDWSHDLPIESANIILAFAVLHHIPGIDERISLLKSTNHLLHSNGIFYLSVWQFLNSPRLRQRIVPWKEVGLEDIQVDPMDYLLDWKHEGYGYRYVHHFSREELEILATSTGFSIIDTFNSDGEGGKLGLYQIWKKKETRTR